MKAVKGNKEYNVDEKQKKSYQEVGFDIFDDTGKLIDYGKGKTVPYGEYMKLKEELETAKAEMRKTGYTKTEEKDREVKKAGE